MIHRTARRVLAFALTVPAVLGLLPPPAVAAPPPPGTAATSAVVTAFGPGAILDDSTLTDCIGPGAAVPVDPRARAAAGGTHARAAARGPATPVAYRIDRIAVREDLPVAVIRAEVRAALDDVGAAAADITGDERIAFESADLKPVTYIFFEATDPPVRIVDLARRLRQADVTASPVYLFPPDSGPSETWPFGNPEATTEVPPTRAAGIGAGITVAVYDLGLPPAARSNWPPNVSRLTPDDVDTLDVRKPYGVVDAEWAGHTLPIADTLATVAPGVTVEAVRMTEPNAVPTDQSAARRMAETLSGAGVNWPDMIINAFGSPACDIDPDDPTAGEMVPLGLELVAEAIEQRSGALLLASAGNRTSERPHYPAAFPGVVSVGALDAGTDTDGSYWTSPSRTGRRAFFSNYGPWVDVWAPGYRLSTRHVIGLRFTPHGQIINGQALVNGTSFTPSYVAALIAEHMVHTGYRAERAWADVAAHGVRCSSDSGGGIAVTLTTLTATPTTPPVTGSPVDC
jgi:hypothetical protein